MTSLLLAKISRPSFAGVSLRKRLFRQLDDRMDRPIIWISAPAGSGKTTLVASYLAHGFPPGSTIPCLWYQVDEGDADLAAFFYYLGLAAKKAAPRYKTPLPLLTLEYLQGIPTFTRRYFESMFSRLLSHKSPQSPVSKKELVKSIPLRQSGGFALVLDNYQDVPDGSAFHEMIAHAMEVIPEGVRVIVLSRQEPPAQFARLLANNRICRIGWEEIKFDLEETEAFIKDRAASGLKRAPAAEILRAATDGWAAGLVLMLEDAGRKGEFADPGFKAEPGENIFNYFANEVFKKTDATTQEFLLKTAFLPDITTDMAQRLTNITDASKILSRLSKNNFFTQEQSGKVPSYRFHPLLRGFLLSHAKERFAEEEITRLQQHAAHMLAESGNPEDAARLFSAAQDWENLTKLILGNAPRLAAEGRSITLHQWLELLPEETRKTCPWCLYWLGVCLMPFNSMQSMACLERAFYLFRTGKDATGTFTAWAGIIDFTVFMLLDLKPLDKWMSVFDDLVREFGGFPSKTIEALATANMFQAMVWRNPEHLKFEYWAERSYALIECLPDTGLQTRVLSNHAFYRILRGDFGQAAVIINSYPRLKSEESSPLNALLMKYIKSLYYSVAEISKEDCLRLAREAIALSDRTGVHLLEISIVGQGALSALSDGDFQSAEGLLDRMTSCIDGKGNVEKAFYHYCMAHKFLVQGDVKKAAAHAEQSYKMRPDIGRRMSEGMTHGMSALCLHEIKDQEGAERHLGEFKDSVAKNGPLDFMYCLIAAYIGFRGFQETDNRKNKQRDVDALGLLKKAMTMGSERGYFGLYAWYPKMMSALCAKALEHGIETEYVQELIRKRRLSPPTATLNSRSLENWPWPLDIHTLGRFEIKIDGKPVPFTGRVQQRPLQLLKAVIANGSRDVDQGRLTDMLWPDAEGDLGNQTFKTTMHRLRQLIGNEKAIIVSDGRVTIDTRYCRVDVLAFEDAVREAETLWSAGQEEKSLSLFEKAFGLYRGDLLPGDAHLSWTVEARERAMSKFIRIIGRLTRHHQSMGRWEQAAEYFQRGLEVNALSEDFYRGLMVCLQQLGRRSEAISAYRRCRLNLHESLGIAPSPETDALYRSIERGK